MRFYFGKLNLPTPHRQTVPWIPRNERSKVISGLCQGWERSPTCASSCPYRTEEPETLEGKLNSSEYLTATFVRISPFCSVDLTGTGHEVRIAEHRFPLPPFSMCCAAELRSLSICRPSQIYCKRFLGLGYKCCPDLLDSSISTSAYKAHGGYEALQKLSKSYEEQTSELQQHTK